MFGMRHGTDRGRFSPAGDFHALAPVPTAQKSWDLTGPPGDSPGGEERLVRRRKMELGGCSRSLTLRRGCGEEKVCPPLTALVCVVPEKQLAPISGPG